MANKDLIVTPNKSVEYATGADRLRWIERGRKAGWKVSEFGRLDSGSTLGPCARCQEVCVRYGEQGRPLCATCRNPSDDAGGVHNYETAGA
jgi:hypothetical protein